MTDELVRGIRRIVGDLEEKPKGIGDAEARKPIGISRGIAYIGRDGSVSSSGGAEGGGNDTSPPNVPQPDTDPDNGVPGDAGGINDGSTGGGTGEALNGDVGAVDELMTSGAEVGQLTGTDPATGDLTSINLNTLDGIEFVPPAGWDDPDTPPPAPTEYFYTFGLPVVDDSASATTEQALIDLFAPDSITVLGPDSCSFPANDFSGVCSAATEHPSTGVCDIRYDHESGGYKGHELDPDCSTAQKESSSFVVVRSASIPSKYFRYTRLENGGTKITTVDSSGVPVPGSVTKTLDASGRVDGFYDVSIDSSIK